jgi:hypothetical protein
MGSSPFFIGYVKAANLFGALVADCPLAPAAIATAHRATVRRIFM